MAGSLVRLAFAVVLVKLLAVFLGPTGMGTLSLYTNLFELFAVIFAAGAAGALNRLVAWRREGAADEAELWQAAIWFVFWPSVILAPALLWLFYRTTKTVEFSWWAALVIAGVFAANAIWRLASSVTMGRQQSGLLLKIMALGSFAPIPVVAGLGLSGVAEPLAYAVLAPVCLFLAVLAMRAVPATRPRMIMRKPASELLSQMRSIALPVVLTMAMVPAMWFYIRTSVENRIGLLELGYLQPSFQFVVIAGALFANAMGVTLVRWDQAREPAFSRKQLALLAAAIVLPVSGALIIQALSPVLDLLIVALFTREFLPASAILPAFLTAEALRMGGFLLTQAFIAKGYNLWTIGPRAVLIAIIVYILQTKDAITLEDVADAYLLGHVGFYAVTMALWVVVQFLPARTRKHAGPAPTSDSGQ